MTESDDIYGEAVPSQNLYMIIYHENLLDKDTYTCGYGICDENTSRIEIKKKYTASEGESGLLVTIDAIESLFNLYSDISSKNIHLYTNSDYVRRGITEWIQGWMNPPKGKLPWRTTKNVEIKHKNLWLKLYQMTQRVCINWHSVFDKDNKFYENVPLLIRNVYESLSKSVDNINPITSVELPNIDRVDINAPITVDMLLDYMYGNESNNESYQRAKSIIEGRLAYESNI